MRTEVLEFLRNLPKSNRDRFNKAFAFLSETKGVSFSQRLSYNASGATESNIKKMIYDLKKFHKITDVEVLSKKRPVIKDIEENQMKIPENADNGANTGTGSSELTPISEETKKTDLHKEFPFLTEKDCPPEMHIVTGLLVASWKRYNELFMRLHAVNEGKEEISEDEKFELAAATNKEFENNDQLYKELVHYRENKKVLADHEALKEHRAKQEIEAMSTADLVKFQKNAASYLSKGKKDLLDEEIPEEKKVIIRERMADRELRLALVNKKLGMNA